LSEDDGPAATEFLEDEFEDDGLNDDDDEPLAERAERVKKSSARDPDAGVSTNPSRV
jgi:hypothetical protein